MVTGGSGGMSLRAIFDDRTTADKTHRIFFPKSVLSASPALLVFSPRTTLGERQMERQYGRRHKVSGI